MTEHVDGPVVRVRQSRVDAAQVLIEIREAQGEPAPETLRTLAAAEPREPAQRGPGRVVYVQRSRVDAARLSIDIRERLGEPISTALRALAAAEPDKPSQMPATDVTIRIATEADTSPPS